MKRDFELDITAALAKVDAWGSDGTGPRKAASKVIACVLKRGENGIREALVRCERAQRAIEEFRRTGVDPGSELHALALAFEAEMPGKRLRPDDPVELLRAVLRRVGVPGVAPNERAARSR